MKTEHCLKNEDSRNTSVDSNSVNLVVTSPPYPMIEMWDEAFGEMNNKILTKLNKDTQESSEAFDLMHDELLKVWKEIDRVLKEDGIVCINIGDATRSIGDTFQLFPNRARIIEDFRSLGYHMLPSIIWWKPTNKKNKFLGSGVKPPNAYVTLEHEHILIFRKKGPREFTSEGRENRLESSYFWDERNEWFSDVWSVSARSQNSSGEREVAAAYPFEIPFRLINMYSVKGDTVLDPFCGTGTTTIASIASARNSIGIDIDSSFIKTSAEKVRKKSKDITKEVQESRLQNQRENADDSYRYVNEFYDVPVKTKGEKDIRLPYVSGISSEDNNSFEITHEIPSK